MKICEPTFERSYAWPPQTVRLSQQKPVLSCETGRATREGDRERDIYIYRERGIEREIGRDRERLIYIYIYML